MTVHRLLSGATRHSLTPATHFYEFTLQLSDSEHRSPDAWRTLCCTLAPHEGDAFREICAHHRLRIVDSIDRQLADLAQIRFPQPNADAARTTFVADAIAAAGGRDSIGVWVAYPWDGKVVHLLAPADYFDVITNRNQNKLDRDELARLRTKRVAVVGLSVGGESAMTIAQEHLCGEIVLADFDRLDLSNMNRLTAGCDELGILKTSIVARRIARIDPFLSVTVYPAGLQEENLDEMFSGLDLLVEECDSLHMKQRARVEARARGINIVYAADERGFLSIEPYALAPDFPRFHGLCTDPQKPRSEYPTALDFWKDLCEWLGGWNGISERSRQSLLQVGDTLCGYPQLASEARFAAGLVGHVARRLLLGDALDPFIGQIDLDEILARASHAR